MGHKAATLAQLLQRGYNVPAGFSLTVEALASTNDPWESPLIDALSSLHPPWAVRSSSTVEDSPLAAYPGLFKTLLDLSDARSVVDAVREVRASQAAELVQTYSKYHGVDPSTIGMAALVQSLVIADSAGVAFTRDPVTDDVIVVIEANFGLGETVVDGSVNPDRYRVDGDGRIDRRIGSKRHKMVATTSGARFRRFDTSELERASIVLSDSQILQIDHLIHRVERDLAVPIDIEWAFAGEQLFLLQARPITTAAD